MREYALGALSAGTSAKARNVARDFAVLEVACRSESGGDVSKDYHRLEHTWFDVLKSRELK